MARQAKQSLDTIGGELEAALSDDPKSKWADATQDALDGVEHAEPVAKELIDELQALSPRAGSDHDRRRSEGARPAAPPPGDERAAREAARRQDQADGRATCPATPAAELAKKLGTAVDEMGKADGRMKDARSVGRARERAGRRRRARQGARPRAQRRPPGPAEPGQRRADPDPRRRRVQGARAVPRGHPRGMRKEQDVGLRGHAGALLRGADPMR